MTILAYKFLLGLFASSLIGGFAYLNQSLTGSGLLAVVFVGTFTCISGPWPTWLVFILFLGSSVFIHWLKKLIVPAKTDTLAEKDHTRDGWQVLANSLPALLCLFSYRSTNDSIFLIAFASGIAGATADTWASELGILSSKPPRSILTHQPMATGLSGGVSYLGTFASVLGSLLIAFVFAYSQLQHKSSSFLFLLFFGVPFFCGICCSLIDSLLGALLQVKYRCVVCQTFTEQPTHHGKPTVKVTGITYITNDWVNFISQSLTILLCLLLLYLIH